MRIGNIEVRNKRFINQGWKKVGIIRQQSAEGVWRKEKNRLVHKNRQKGEGSKMRK